MLTRDPVAARRANETANVGGGRLAAVVGRNVGERAESRDADVSSGGP